MIQKKYYLFLLSIFVPLFSMEQPKEYFSLLRLPGDVLKKIAGNYLQDHSINSLMRTCSLLHQQNFSSIFIKDKDGKLVKDRHSRLIRFTNSADVYYRDNVDWCRSALSFFAKHCVYDGYDEYKNYFEQLYSLRADERNAGVMAVLDIKEKPSMQDCIRVYSGDCRKQADRVAQFDGKFFYTNRLLNFIKNANVEVINTMLADNYLCYWNGGECDSIFGGLCFLNDYCIKKILKHNGFYRMPSLVSNNCTDFENFRRNITIQTFAYVIRNKEQNLIDMDIICEGIEPSNSGLYFLFWMQDLAYLNHGKNKYKNDFIEKFINTKKIDLNQSDERGERILDYVYSRVKMLYNAHLTIAQLINLGCDIDAVDSKGKTLLQREGEKYYKFLSNHCERDYNNFFYFCAAKESLRALLQNKMNQLKELKKIDMPIDDYGNTVLHYASMFRFYGEIDQAFAAGVDINVQNVAGMTPVFLACLLFNNFAKENTWSDQNDYYLIISKLCVRGADLNKIDNENRLPFFAVCDALRCFLNKMKSPSERYAFEDPCLQIVKLFFNCGADIQVRTPDGKLAYHDLDVDTDIASYVFDEKMGPFKTLAYCGLALLVVYGFVKYFQDK